MCIHHWLPREERSLLTWWPKEKTLQFQTPKTASLCRMLRSDWRSSISSIRLATDTSIPEVGKSKWHSLLAFLCFRAELVFKQCKKMANWSPLLWLTQTMAFDYFFYKTVSLTGSFKECSPNPFLPLSLCIKEQWQKVPSEHWKFMASR